MSEAIEDFLDMAIIPGIIGDICEAFHHRHEQKAL